MAIWDEGWLPEGWTRGAVLRVVNAYWRDGENAALVTLPTLRARNTIVSPLVLVQFHHAERGRVAHWLRWYFDVPYSEAGCAEYKHIVNQIR